MNKVRLALLVFLIVLISFVAKGCSFLPTTSLTILQYYLEKNVGEEGNLTAEIVGGAVNDGGARLEYAEIKGNFYSQDGTLLATGLATTTSLDPGEIWDFTIISDPREAHASLNIRSWNLKKDSSGARIIGEAENNGGIMLSFAKITGTFYSSPSGTELASGTATTTMLGVGEIWQFVIPCAGPYAEKIGRVTIEVTEIDYWSEQAQDVHHVTAEVGVLRGSTVMP